MGDGYPNMMCFGYDIVNCTLGDACPDYQECQKQYEESWRKLFDINVKD